MVFNINEGDCSPGDKHGRYLALSSAVYRHATAGPDYSYDIPSVSHMASGKNDVTKATGLDEVRPKNVKTMIGSPKRIWRILSDTMKVV